MSGFVAMRRLGEGVKRDEGLDVILLRLLRSILQARRCPRR